jgi:hypothetical protein
MSEQITPAPYWEPKGVDGYFVSASFKDDKAWIRFADIDGVVSEDQAIELYRQFLKDYSKQIETGWKFRLCRTQNAVYHDSGF